jgi:CBS domain-containing protein
MASPVDQHETATSQGKPSPILKPRTGSTSSTSTANNTPSVSHRSSYADGLRNYPPSPRAQRQHSFSGPALAELLKNPPVKMTGDERFKGRDWRSIQVSEIVETSEVRFVQLDTSIEDTTKLLIKSGAPNVVLVRESTKTKTAIGTFDYSDLNAYLLLVLGLSAPDSSANQLANRARTGDAIPLADLLDHLGAREMPTFLPHTADLTKAMEVLGGGSHRLIICKEGTQEVVGLLSQLRLVRFFWENHQNFSATEALYSRSLRELKLGDKEVLSINGDKPLKEALEIMNDEGVTSLPVLDNHKNVVGNISHVDVRVRTTSFPPTLPSALTHPRSSSRIPPRSPYYPPAASISSASFCPNAVWKTAKTACQSFT